MKKVNKELFEALESAKRIYGNDLQEMLQLKFDKSYFFEREILNDLNLNLFIELLVNGYELEESPEEKLIKEYNRPSVNEYHKGVDDGIKFTLNTLGIKIKGINS